MEPSNGSYYLRNSRVGEDVGGFRPDYFARHAVRLDRERIERKQKPKTRKIGRAVVNHEPITASQV